MEPEISLARGAGSASSNLKVGLKVKGVKSVALFGVGAKLRRGESLSEVLCFCFDLVLARLV